MKALLLFTLGILIIPSFTLAENFEISVTRKGPNIYKVEGKDVIIQTKYCYEYAYSEDAILRSNGYLGDIIFLDSAGKCSVKAIYGKSEQQPGKYAVNVSLDEDDWYEIIGHDMYIKTYGCLNLSLGVDAILSINSEGFGTLYIEDDRCMVEGIYSKLKF